MIVNHRAQGTPIELNPPTNFAQRLPRFRYGCPAFGCLIEPMQVPEPLGVNGFQQDMDVVVLRRAAHLALLMWRLSCNMAGNFECLAMKSLLLIAILLLSSVAFAQSDSAKKHQGFIRKNSLPFRLFVDEDLSVTKAYGAWGIKKMYGKEYEGLLRTTFVIDGQGVILKIISPVEAKNHAAQILESLA